MEMSRFRRIGRIGCLAAAGAGLTAFALATVAFTEERRRFNNDLAHVVARDGINADEAQGIALVYFQLFISGCGGPDRGKLTGGEWIVPASEGYGGRPLASPLHIDAKGGAISYANGPTFSSYRTFRVMALWGLPFYSLDYSIRRFIDNTVTRYSR